MKNNTIAIDLAKSVFQVTGFNPNNEIIFNKRLKRKELTEFIKKQESGRIVMEACYSSNYWGRTFQNMGHQVELIPAQHVTPFVRGNKNDANDALAIFEASNRPLIKPVPVKTEAQQAILALHKVRERLIRNKTSISNQLRGILADFGITPPRGHKGFETALSQITSGEIDVPEPIFAIVQLVAVEHLLIKKSLLEINKKILESVEKNDSFKILTSIPGVGPLIASAIISSIDQGQRFKNAREFAVWLGLTPKHYASGNTLVTGKISKRGNTYLRTLLIHGARSVVCFSHRKSDPLNMWINQLRSKKTFNCTVVAYAHKMARIIWSLLRKGISFNSEMAAS